MNWATTLPKLQAIPGVEWVDLLAGQYDFVMLVRTHILEELRESVLSEGLLGAPGIISTETAVLLGEHRRGAAESWS